MNTFNKVLNIIIIVLMISSTIAFTINVIVFGVGEFQTNTLSYYLLIMIAGTIALLLTPEDDLYSGYIPEPDQSTEYEKIQRDLYDKGYDMSKDIEYFDDLYVPEPECSDEDIEYSDELYFEL